MRVLLAILVLAVGFVAHAEQPQKFSCPACPGEVTDECCISHSITMDLPPEVHRTFCCCSGSQTCSVTFTVGDGRTTVDVVQRFESRGCKGWKQHEMGEAP